MFSILINMKKAVNAILKIPIHFLWGLTFGFCFFFFTLTDLEFNKKFTLVVSIGIGLSFAIGCVASIYVRCITLLFLPRVFGKTGRGVVKTFALVYVMSGPMANLALNTKEVVQVFSCTTQLTYNLTKTKYDLMVRPFQETLLGMKHDSKEVNQLINSIEGIVQPIVEEVEGEEEVEKLKKETDYIDEMEGDSHRSEQIEKKYGNLKERKRNAGNDSGMLFEEEYKRKLEYRCEGVINAGSKKCSEMFQGAYDKCYDKVSALAAWLLCWPMKLDFVCNVVSVYFLCQLNLFSEMAESALWVSQPQKQTPFLIMLAEVLNSRNVFGGKEMCNPEKVVEPGFGDSYLTVKDSKEIFNSSFGDVNIKYVLKGDIPQLDPMKAKEYMHHSARQIKSYEKLFKLFLLTVKRVMALLTLYIMYTATEYQDKYLTDIDFDNHYVTDYFLKIDRRRLERGDRYLLPLRREEMKVFVNPRAIFPDRRELSRIIRQSFVLIFEMLPASSFFFMDWAFYNMLDLIARYAHVEFTQEGHHELSIKVIGTGMVAKMVRSLLKGFDISKQVHVIHSNEACLPHPSKLPSNFIRLVYGLYFIAWFSILADAYTVRLNRLICAWFYRKQEKRRILFLYNETLRHRIIAENNILVDADRKVQEAEMKFQTNFLLRLRLKNPKKFGWLRVLPFARQQCLLCGFLEPTKGDFIECLTADCVGRYCTECWYDLDNTCVACIGADALPAEQESSDGEENVRLSQNMLPKR